MSSVRGWIACVLVASGIFVTCLAFAAPESMPFYVYQDKASRLNHYVPSGWMGDFGDIKMDDNHKVNPHSGTSCLKFTYSAAGKQGANWAGVYWLNPPNNWGERKGGFDLSPARRLTFWARGEKGGEQLIEFKMGGIAGTYSDTDSASIGPIELGIEWKQYEIDLSGLDISHITGGFCWVTNSMANPDGCVFYLDEIKYE